MLREEGESYAFFKNETIPQITPKEMKVFIGIFIITGYNILTGKKFYWDMKPDIHNLLVAEAMRRDRFIQIMRYIHAVDNMKMSKTDKMWKLRPLNDRLQQ